MKRPAFYLGKIQIKIGLSADAPGENATVPMVSDGLMREVICLMSSERLLLSEKYKSFLRCDAPVEFLEGT